MKWMTYNGGWAKRWLKILWLQESFFISQKSLKENKGSHYRNQMCCNWITVLQLNLLLKCRTLSPLTSWVEYVPCRHCHFERGLARGLAWGIWVDVSCACVFNNDWNWLMQEGKGAFQRTVICEYRSFLQHPACTEHVGVYKFHEGKNLDSQCVQSNRAKSLSPIKDASQKGQLGKDVSALDKCKQSSEKVMWMIKGTN